MIDTKITPQLAPTPTPGTGIVSPQGELDRISSHVRSRNATADYRSLILHAAAAEEWRTLCCCGFGPVPVRPEVVVQPYMGASPTKEGANLISSLSEVRCFGRVLGRRGSKLSRLEI